MKHAIYYGSQKIDEKDIKAVKDSLGQKFLTTGPLSNLFEQKIKKKLKVKYANVCNSGTSAIYLSLKAIGIKKGDTVISPAVNFISAANVLKLFGARLVFSDIDPITSQSRPDHILDCIKKNK